MLVVQGQLESFNCTPQNNYKIFYSLKVLWTKREMDITNLPVILGRVAIDLSKALLKLALASLCLTSFHLVGKFSRELARRSSLQTSTNQDSASNYRLRINTLG